MPIKLREYRIYTLRCPISYDVKYVGKTCSEAINDRLSSHIWESRNRKLNKRTAWIKSLLNKNLRPVITEIDSCMCPVEINYLEAFYIRKYKQLGYDLKNAQPGGEGQPRGYVFKSRYVPEKGKQPDHFKKYNGITGRKWTPQQALNFKNARRGAVVKRKYYDVIDVRDDNRTTFVNLKEVARYLRIAHTILVSRRKIITIYNRHYIVIPKGETVPNNVIPYKRLVARKDTDGAVTEFDSIMDASRKIGINRSAISRSIKKSVKDKAGNMWYYVY
jgi:hypothetical protein